MENPVRRIGVRQWIGFGLLGVLLIAIIYSVVGTLWRHPVEMDEPAPNFALSDLQSHRFRLSDERGKIVVLNFFTTWCPPCQEEAPTLAAFQAKYSDRAQLVMIDRQESQATVQSFIHKYNLGKAIVVLDHSDSMVFPYGITGQPETFYITAQGVVVKHVIGPVDFADMEQQMALMSQ